jgi:hypothetical protein
LQAVSWVVQVIIEFFFISLSLLSSGIIDLSNEKKATSHPDVSADNTRKIKIKIIFTITEI